MYSTAQGLPVARCAAPSRGAAGRQLGQGARAQAPQPSGGQSQRRDTAAGAANANSAAAVTMRGVDFIRPHLRSMAAYTPIEPFEVLSERLGRAPQDIIKLDANENPYGPPPEVRQALAALEFPHIYPDPEARRLRAALAADCGISADYIMAGCGADELIDILMRCVLEPGDSILNCPPTFGMYAFDADVNNAKVIDVPRRADFSVDVPAVLEAARKQKPKMLFLTSPNNPDGCVMNDEDVKACLELPCLVVLDEAYIEFGAAPSRMKWVEQYENLVVLRTFSKRAGLAGLRIGYGAFPLSLIEFLWRAKQPYNVSVAAEVAACAALSNPAYLEDVKVKLVSERQRLFSVLSKLPGLHPYPSAANFILCKVDGAKLDAAALKERLMMDEGIMVRYYSKPAALAGCIRVSVGTPEQTDKVEAALRRLLA